MSVAHPKDSVTPSGALAMIVADAYRIFARYPAESSLCVCHCNCCMTEENEALLVRTPLREISSELLAQYTNSAHDWDDVVVRDQMRYFLPRYLELIAANDAPHHNSCLEHCLSRLQDAKWRETWPADEVDVLNRFFPALIVARLDDLSLAHWPVGWLLANDVCDILCLTVLSGGDIVPVLKAWDEAGDPGAAIHFAAARRSVKRIEGDLRLDSAFLERYVADAKLIGEFLSRPQVDQRLEATFFMIDDPRLQKIVSDATWD
jgi:hypothetical protein